MVHGIVRDFYPGRFGVNHVARHRGERDTRPTKHSSESASELKASSVTADRSLQRVDDDPADALSLHSATQLAFRVRSQTKLRVNDDGSLRAVNKTQLRFSYDLETEDGQRIQLRAKAKIKQSVTLDENGDIAIKTRVKFQFSLIQKDVSDGLSPLQGATNENEADSTPNPLQSFLDVIDSIVADYADDGQIDADALIKTVLDEFNSLFANLSGGSTEPIEAGAIDAGTIDGKVIDAPVRPAPAVRPDAEAGAEVIEAAAPSEPTTLETETEAEGEGALLVAQPPATGVESSPHFAPRPLTETAPADEGETDPVIESLANSADAETPVETAQDILQKVRIRFVQSFTQVIKTLTPEGEDDTSGLSLFQQSSFKFDARVQYSAPSTPGSSTDFLA